MLTLVLQSLDAGTARAVGGILVRALPPGSHLIATAVPTTGSLGPGKPAQASLPGFIWTGPFTVDDLASFFAGLDLVPPGVTEGPGAPGGRALCAAGVKSEAPKSAPVTSAGRGPAGGGAR